MEENIKTRWAWRQIRAVRPVKSHLLLSHVYNVKRALNYCNIHSESVWEKTRMNHFWNLEEEAFFKQYWKTWNLSLIETWKHFWVYHNAQGGFSEKKKQIHRNQIPSLLPLAHLVECKIGEKRECFMRESTTDQMLNLKCTFVFKIKFC